MNVKIISNEDDTVHVGCQGDIAHYHFGSGPDPLEDLLGPGCYTRKVIFNFEQASYIDSSGLGWLMAMRKRFAEKGGQMVLHSVPPMVDNVIRLVKLHTILPIAANAADARSLLSTSK